jgi:hypothetical protein
MEGSYNVVKQDARMSINQISSTLRFSRTLEWNPYQLGEYHLVNQLQ